MEVAYQPPKLLDLPEEVIEGRLLPFLRWNDLLRFRRVCQTIKAITDGYLRANVNLAPEIEINEKDKSFGKFLEMNLPTTKIFLNNVSGNQFFEKDAKNVARFRKTFGPIITSLRVDQLSLALYGKERDFMDALVNLRHYEVGKISYGPAVNVFKTDAANWKTVDDIMTRHDKDTRYKPDRQVIPKSLKNLSTLKIGQEKNMWRPLRKKVDLLSYKLLIWNQTSLDYVRLPFTTHDEVLIVDESRQPPHLRFPQYSIYLNMNVLLGSIVDTKSHFKVFDFVNFHDAEIGREVHWNAAVQFADLCAFSLQNGIKLRNVAAFWFTRFARRPYEPEFGNVIVSMVGLHPGVLSLYLDMVSLERLEIRATSTSSVGHNWRQERPEWPSLKQLDVTVDSKKTEYLQVLEADEPDEENEVFFIPGETKTLFQFFFEDIVRPELTEISFKFTKDVGIAVPKTREIVESCPNLKKLTLVNWPGTNKALIELFGGLPGLEEVSFESCKNLGNVTFVGTDTSRPVFLKLKKFRKLTLKSLDHMPKITDLLFTMVIRHLKLSHLTLTSNSPIQSITRKGIQALLDGDFAVSIEKFPFHGFSLEGVPAEEWKEMEMQFRSYNML